jgi:hypothetical protein
MTNSSKSNSHKLRVNVPRWGELMAAVNDGHQEFIETLRSTGLLERYGRCASEVHGYEEIELHAITLAIPSAGRPDEMRAKSFLTYASHWIDDFFDSPVHVIDPAQLMRDRADIRCALANMGPPGRVGFAMAARVRHPQAVFQCLHRMLYGGLAQRSTCSAERHMLAQEYREVATRCVRGELVRRINQIQLEAYWTTNKTVLEIANAVEPVLDFDTTELWNLLFAPAIYCQDAAEERARGELNFSADEEPRLPELLKMIELAVEYLVQCRWENDYRVRQIEFVARFIPNLPDEVSSAYAAVIRRLDSLAALEMPAVDGESLAAGR